VGAAAADTRTLWLRNLHTKEELRLQPFGLWGLVQPTEWAQINRFFRSWRSGDRRPINPRLIRVLAQIQRHFDGRPLEIVSGYRVRDDPAQLTSYHQVGHAVLCVAPHKAPYAERTIMRSDDVMSVADL
jgi:uncharacterized protein YcbK (DUF882 family)